LDSKRQCRISSTFSRKNWRY